MDLLLKINENYRSNFEVIFEFVTKEYLIETGYISQAAAFKIFPARPQSTMSIKNDTTCKIGMLFNTHSIPLKPVPNRITTFEFKKRV